MPKTPLVHGSSVVGAPHLQHLQMLDVASLMNGTRRVQTIVGEISIHSALHLDDGGSVAIGVYLFL